MMASIPLLVKCIISSMLCALLLFSTYMWLFNISLINENWDCVYCHAEQTISSTSFKFLSHFLYYSMWNLVLTTFVFIRWIFFFPSSRDKTSDTGAHDVSLYASDISSLSSSSIRTSRKNGGERNGQFLTTAVFQVALPHSLVVCLAYLYYIISTPQSEFLNTELCHVNGRGFLNKSVTDDIRTINLYLTCLLILDWTMHYLCPILLVYIYMTNSIPFFVSVPYSAIFASILSIFVILAHTAGDVMMYCEGLALTVVSITGGNAVISLLLSFVRYRSAAKRQQQVGGAQEKSIILRSIEPSSAVITRV